MAELQRGKKTRSLHISLCNLDYAVEQVSRAGLQSRGGGQGEEKKAQFLDIKMMVEGREIVSKVRNHVRNVRCVYRDEHGRSLGFYSHNN